MISSGDRRVHASVVEKERRQKLSFLDWLKMVLGREVQQEKDRRLTLDRSIRQASINLNTLIDQARSNRSV